MIKYKNGPTACKTGSQIEKTEMHAGCNFIHRRSNVNLFQLRRKIEESIRFKSDLEGNAVNLTAFLSQKVNVKLLNKNLDFTPTLKVYNKNKLDSNLNNLSRLIKLIIKHNSKTQLVRILTAKKITFKAHKNKEWVQDKNHYILMPLLKLLKEILYVLKFSNLNNHIQTSMKVKEKQLKNYSKGKISSSLTMVKEDLLSLWTQKKIIKEAEQQLNGERELSHITSRSNIR